MNCWPRDRDFPLLGYFSKKGFPIRKVLSARFLCSQLLDLGARNWNLTMGTWTYMAVCGGSGR